MSELPETLFTTGTKMQKEQNEKEKTKEKEKIDFSKMNIYQKMTAARAMLGNMPLKKTGENKYSKFMYFELADFLPEIVQIEAEVGLTSIFRIYPGVYDRDKETGMVTTLQDETAELKIINADKPDENIIFNCKAVDAKMSGGIEIQAEGAKNTYYRRYLWMNAFEITENDMVDAGHEDKPEKAQDKARPITAGQMKVLESVDPGRVVKMLEYYKVKTLSEMTMEQASDAISRLKETKNA